MRWLVLSAFVALAGLSVLNWRARLQTQQKLEALAAALAVRPAPAQAPPPAAPPAPTVQEPGSVPKELSPIKPSPYIIEAPDLLMIEAALKDPKTGTIGRLPDQPLSGQFLVRPDGTVGLGTWGSVVMAGLTTDQAVAAVLKHLAKRSDRVSAENLVVGVQVAVCNSKRYYVTTDGPGENQQVFAFPITGNECVLDALAQLGRVAEKSSKVSIRVVRSQEGSAKVLPVDWNAMTRQGITTTNYQLLPGDRIFVTGKAD